MTETAASAPTAPIDASAAPVAPNAPAGKSPSRRGTTKGLTITAPVAATLLAVAMGWSAWVTKELRSLGGDEPKVASMSVQPLITEYIAAQARSGLPPEQAAGQTQAFMKALEEEIKRRGRRGQTILMAEAVLSKNVNDITPDVRRAIYARVPMPPALQQTAMASATR